MAKQLFFLSLFLCSSIILLSQTTQDTALINAEINLLKGNYEKTLKTFDRHNSRANSNIQWLQLRALAYENLGQFDSAESVYSKILNSNNNDLDAIGGLARIYTATGKVASAKAKWEQALMLDTLNRTTRLSYARLLKRENEFCNAIKQYQWLVRNDTCNFSHWEQIGDCAVGMGKIDVAFEAYNSSFYCNPANAPLAAKYLQFMAISGAPAWIVLPVATIAIEADTTYAPLNRTMGYIQFFYNKDYKAAEKWLTKAYEMGDTSRFTTKHLGITLYYNGYFTRASEMLARAYASDSTDRMLNFVLARAYMDIGERFKAQKLLSLNELLIMPDTLELSVIYATRGELHYKAMEYQLAIKNYEKAFELDPTSLQYYFQIGLCYNGLNKSQTALNYFEEFLKRNDEFKVSKPAKVRLSEETLAKYYQERLRKELFFLDEKN